MLIHKNVNYVMQPAKNVKEKLLINVQAVLMDYFLIKDHAQKHVLLDFMLTHY